MRILLVDDAPAVLRGYVRLIREAEVCTAAGVKEARNILDDGFEPDVVISDFNMPDGTGEDVLTLVKRRCPRCQCHIASGAVDEIPEAVHELADAVLGKDSPELIRLLKSLGPCSPRAETENPD